MAIGYKGKGAEVAYGKFQIPCMDDVIVTLA